MISRKWTFGMLALLFAILPSVVYANGLCEELCGKCYFSDEVVCAKLDGCSVSANECYFVTDACNDCPET